MEYLEKIYRLADIVSITLRNTRPFSKAFYYIFFSLAVRLIRPSKYFIFEGRKIYFSSFSSTLYCIEEIFMSKSLDFVTNRKSPVIIDAGANVGISALYYKSLYPKAKITCIEPIPQTFINLKKNLKDFTDLTILNTAVSENVRSKYFYIPRKREVFDASISIFKPNHGMSFKRIKVNSIKLSSLIKEPVDCLVLDIEGNEDKILLELEKTKKIKLIKNIFVEFHAYPGNSLGTIASVLERNGFDLVYGCGVRPPFHKYLNKFHAIPLYAKRRN